MRKLFFASLMLIGGMVVHARSSHGAEAWQSHASIRAAAQSFLVEYVRDNRPGRSQVELGQLDPRLRLKHCAQPLQGFLPAGSRTLGNTTVGVRCPTEPGWRIYVSARIKVFGQVVVTRQPLARGALIRAADLEQVERNLAALPYGYYTKPGPLVGMLAKRTIAAATAVTPQMLQAPKLVKRGERVTLVAETGRLEVRMTGEALADGASGDLIRVRAEGSRRVIDGRVVSQGVVKVTL